MNVAEIFIHHMLWETDGAMHITEDGTKLYFILDGHLMYIDTDLPLRDMTVQELRDLIKKEVSELQTSR